MPTSQITTRTLVKFDTGALDRSKQKGQRRALMRAGAYVRTVSRRLIKKRKTPSIPGKPPSGHTQTLRNFILYAYSPQNESVLIGPTLVPGRVSQAGPQAPEAMEHGGTVRRKQRGSRKRVTITYKKRPTMATGLAQSIQSDALAPFFANTIRPA